MYIQYNKPHSRQLFVVLAVRSKTKASTLCAVGKGPALTVRSKTRTSTLCNVDYLYRRHKLGVRESCEPALSQGHRTSTPFSWLWLYGLVERSERRSSLHKGHVNQFSLLSTTRQRLSTIIRQSIGPVCSLEKGVKPSSSSPHRPPRNLISGDSNWIFF